MNAKDTARLAREASTYLLTVSEDQRVHALKEISKNIKSSVRQILEANAHDIKDALKNKLTPALIDRLTLNEKSIEALGDMCLSVAAQEAVVGHIVETSTRPNGLIIEKQRIPLGVIGMIFESRPNVVVDGAALAIKSGNAIILKGGKEAQHSNRALFDIISRSIKNILPDGSVSLIETREDVSEILKLDEFIDLMVPRGGSALIQYVKENATMPVVAHDKGLCHLYVEADAQIENVIPIVLNAKVQRPGVCNAIETLLLHQHYPENKKVLEALEASKVEIRGCERTQELLPHTKLARPLDYHTEYQEKIISVKIVKDINEAITHIHQHSSHHTEAILTESPALMEQFLNSVDAAAVVINASTRFNDGGELGLGAELGISTSKLHAYGPMGAKEMTTTRFLVKGSGQIRQ
jgi:glutamate-5-semialdehyde dehydrogenase